MIFLKKLLPYFSIPIIIGLLYASCYGTFQTDDYHFYNLAKEKGALTNAFQLYSSWSGRLWSFFLIGFLMKNFLDLEFFPLFYYSTSLFAFWLLLSLNIRKYFKLNYRNCFLYSFGILVMYYVSLFSTSEHIFWITGSVVYFLTDIYILLILLIYRKKHSFFNTILLIFCSFLVVFSNEVSAIILVGIWLLLWHNSKNLTHGILFLSSLIFLLISFSAPGNFVRLGADTSSIELLTKTAKVFFPTLALVVIKLIPSAVIIHFFLTERIKNYLFSLQKYFYGLTGILIIAILFLSLTMALERTLNALVLLVLLLYQIFFQRIEIKNNWIDKAGLIALLIILTPAIYIFPKKQQYFRFDYHLYSLFHDVTNHTLPKFAKEHQKRIHRLKHSNENIMYCEPIQNVPKTIYFFELAKDKNDQQYASYPMKIYYNKKEIWRRK